MELLVRRESKLDAVGTGLNRIIIVDDYKTVKNIFTTRKGASWYFKEGKPVQRNNVKALFNFEEGMLRGSAFVLSRSVEQRETIKALYCNPMETLLTTDKVLKIVVSQEEEKLGTLVEKNKRKYPLAVEETDRCIVVNLITQELHRMSFIEKYLEENNLLNAPTPNKIGTINIHNIPLIISSQLISKRTQYTSTRTQSIAIKHNGKIHLCLHNISLTFFTLSPQLLNIIEIFLFQ